MNTKSFVLPNVLDLKAALPLAEGLLSLRGSDLVVDASQVERMGGQCLQVLISTAATWQAEGLSLEFAQTSEAFTESLKLFGIAGETLFGNNQAAENLH